MEKMNFTVMPSLEHLALFKIAITLWKKQSDTFDYNQTYSDNLSNFWKLVELGSEKLVYDLALPIKLKIKVLVVYKTVCMEIRLWIKLHSKFISREFHWLCIYADWTPIGTIDNKRTALKLVRNQKLPLIDRYELACIYCFDKFIHVLYYKLIGSDNYDFERSNHVDGDTLFRHLLNIWYFKITGYCDYSHFELLVYATCSGNRAAAQYFFQKLSIETKDKYLVRIATAVLDSRNRGRTTVPREEYSKILFFLLQQMNVEQVTKLMQSNAYDVLKCFLDWPLQYHFMAMSKYSWNYFNESSYNSILSSIALKSRQGYQDWDYEELRREFLQQSPDACKRYFK